MRTTVYGHRVAAQWQGTNSAQIAALTGTGKSTVNRDLAEAAVSSVPSGTVATDWTKAVRTLTKAVDRLARVSAGDRFIMSRNELCMAHLSDLQREITRLQEVGGKLRVPDAMEVDS